MFQQYGPIVQNSSCELGNRVGLVSGRDFVFCSHEIQLGQLDEKFWQDLDHSGIKFWPIFVVRVSKDKNAKRFAPSIEVC